ncbi:MAG: hypothetical protein EAX95_16565 [Candidatus Thorarchaeota archaeon]|nr:hypothetical protein [Candidatus Thorarchaeota archaeon]
MDSAQRTEDKDYIRCVLCGQSVRIGETVRFRGAVTCRTCAEKSMSFEEEGKMRWLFWLAALGGFLGAAITFPAQIAFFTGQQGFKVELYYAIVGISVGLLSLGFAGLSKNFEDHYGVIPASLGLIATPLGIIFSLQLVPEYSESLPPFTPPLGVSVSLAADVFVSAFMLFCALVILLSRDRFKSEILSTITATLLLVAGSARYWVPFSVPLAYLLTGFLFGLIRDPVEQGLLANLDFD